MKSYSTSFCILRVKFRPSHGIKRQIEIVVQLKGISQPSTPSLRVFRCLFQLLHLVVGTGRSISTCRCSVVTTVNRLVVSVVVKRTAGSSAVRSSNSGAGHVSVMAGAVVTSTRSKSSVAGGRGSGDSSDFRVTKLVVTVLALPEFGAGATGVVVGRARTETLLLLVVSAEEELYWDG